jgi:hypothetical protein
MLHQSHVSSRADTMGQLWPKYQGTVPYYTPRIKKELILPHNKNRYAGYIYCE